MTDLMSRRGLLRGLFAMPAVILTPKLLMPIKAFIMPPEPFLDTWAAVQAGGAPGEVADFVPTSAEPKFFRWVVKVELEDTGGLGFTMTDDAEQAAAKAAAAAAAWPGATITSGR